MKITVNIKRRHFCIIALALFLCSALLAVQAFNSNPGNLPNEPARLGHSGDELQVMINGLNKTLQKAIDDKDFSKECRLLKDEVMSAGTYAIKIPEMCIGGVCAISLNDYGMFYSQYNFVVGSTYYNTWFAIGTTALGNRRYLRGYVGFSSLDDMVINSGDALLYDDYETGDYENWGLEVTANSQVRLVVCGVN